MALLAVLQLLDQHPHLQHIQVLQLLKFLRLAALLKQDIGLAQPARLELDAAPDHLPQSVSTFLADATGVGSDAVPNLWAVFRDEVWVMEREDESSLEETFRTHGWHLGITSLTVYPPTRTCTNAACPRVGAALTRAEQRQVVVYSLAHGVRPAWSIHLSCSRTYLYPIPFVSVYKYYWDVDCRTNYHNNFSVHAGIQTYYP
ncbi:hypothetical protein B0H14DRAFT_3135523, partial [Mycena olivaceomarginata]